jgi:hypothetical protein
MPGVGFVGQCKDRRGPAGMQMATYAGWRSFAAYIATDEMADAALGRAESAGR